jgi:hypothetical protein
LNNLIRINFCTGIDMGLIKHFMTTSSGDVVDNPGSFASLMGDRRKSNKDSQRKRRGAIKEKGQSRWLARLIRGSIIRDGIFIKGKTARCAVHVGRKIRLTIVPV